MIDKFLSLKYFISNVILRLIPSVETYRLFLSTKNIPTRSEWNLLSTLLLDRSKWVKSRQILHTKIINTFVNNYKVESPKIERAFLSKLGFKYFKSPIVILVRGTSGSGKTTFINNVLGLKTSVVSPDKIRLMLKGELYITGKSDNQYDLESYAVNYWLSEELFKQKYNLVIERTLEYLKDLEIIVNLCQKYSYNALYIVDIDTPLNLCLDRIRRRLEDGPEVPSNSVKDCFNRVSKNRLILVNFLKSQRIINIIYELYSNIEIKKPFRLKSKMENIID